MKPTLETVQLEGNHSIGVLHYSCEAFQENHGWHFHPEYELSLILKGSGKRLVGDSIEQFKAGDVLFLGPNIPHCWISDETNHENEMLVLQFRESVFQKTLLDTPEAHALSTLLEHAKRGIQLADREALEAKLQLIEMEKSSGLKRLALFISLMDTLCEAEHIKFLTSEFYTADNSQFNSGRLAKVMEYVKSYLADDIKQSDVAEHVCMTPQSFSRFFKATTGRTFVSFLNIMRVTEACRMLVNSSMDIGDIATSCGYANISNFNRRFAEIKNCTPSQYRKKHKLAEEAVS